MSDIHNYFVYKHHLLTLVACTKSVNCTLVTRNSTIEYLTYLENKAVTPARENYLLRS